MLNVCCNSVCNLPVININLKTGQHIINRFTQFTLSVATNWHEVIHGQDQIKTMAMFTELQQQLTSCHHIYLQKIQLHCVIAKYKFLHNKNTTMKCKLGAIKTQFDSLQLPLRDDILKSVLVQQPIAISYADSPGFQLHYFNVVQFPISMVGLFTYVASLLSTQADFNFLSIWKSETIANCYPQDRYLSPDSQCQ